MILNIGVFFPISIFADKLAANIYYTTLIIGRLTARPDYAKKLLFLCGVPGYFGGSVD